MGQIWPRAVVIGLDCHDINAKEHTMTGQLCNYIGECTYVRGMIMANFLIQSL